jgi:hypothetical protein
MIVLRGVKDGKKNRVDGNKECFKRKKKFKKIKL